jgi:hypothetical protein
MSRVTDKDVEHAAPPPATEPAGKVEVDSRGNNVWRWARDVLESTSVLLKRLENKDLALEPTQKVPVMRGDTPAPRKGAKPGAPSAARESSADGSAPRHPALQREREPRDTGGGFDPYNSR